MDLDKLNQGKKTFSTLFKGNSSRADEITRLTHFIAQGEKDILTLERLISVIVIHLSKIIIPNFKRTKC